jgi:hypothetical protein
MAKKPSWTTKGADAYTIARIIADRFNWEQGNYFDTKALRFIAGCMADAFDFTDEEEEQFVAAALVNRQDDDDAEDDAKDDDAEGGPD